MSQENNNYQARRVPHELCVDLLSPSDGAQNQDLDVERLSNQSFERLD